MADNKQVGVQFVAQDEQQFAVAMDDAAKSVEQFDAAIEASSNLSTDFGNRWRSAFMAFREVGATPQQALEGINAAADAGIKPQTLLNEVLTKRFGIEQELAASGKGWNEIQKEMNDLAGRGEQETYKLGLAFFAMSIAARGVRDIGRELGEIYGHDVTLAFQKVSDTMQTIGSFGSGGALIGSLFGVGGTAAGAAVGGFIGVLATLPSVLDQTSQATKDLNAELDKLANKGDVTTALEKLTHSTQAESTEMVKLANESPQVATALQEFANQAEHTRGILDALNGTMEVFYGKGQTLGKMLQDLGGFFGNIGNTANQYIILTLGAVAAGDAFKKTLLETGDVAKAHAAAIEALRTVVLGDTDATKDNSKAKLDNALATQKNIDAATELGKAYDSQIQKLNPTKDILSDLTGLTDDNVSEMYNYVKAHKDAGDALAKSINALKELKQAQLEGKLSSDEATYGIVAATAAVDQQAYKLYRDSEAAKQAAEGLKILEAGEKALATAMDTAANATANLTARTAAQHDAAQQQYQDAIDNASRSAGEAEANALQTRQDRLSDLWTLFSDKVVDINRNLAQKIEDIQTGLADRLASIQTTLNDAIANAEQQLADKLSNINQELANQKADLAHKYADTVAQDNQKITDAAQALADKLLEIERNRIQATEDLAFNTHEQIETAKTDHDKARILENAREQQAVIDRNANNQARDAERSEKEQIDSINREKARAKQEYDYELSLAERAAAQKRAEAQRSFEEQIAAAQRTAAEQTAIAQRQAAEQSAIAKREAQDAADANKRSYDEQTAAAKRSYAEQIAQAQKAEADKMADARRSLDERNKAIDASAALEQAAINKTRDAAIKAYQEIMQHLTNLIGVIKAFMQVQLEAIGLSAYMAGTAAGVVTNLTGGWISEMQKLIGQGLTAGGSVTTPTPASGGTNNGSLLGRLAGGNSTVHAPVTSNNSRSINMPIYINDATDPVRVGNIVRQTINDALRGNG